jgi:hypothetical protein
MNSKDRKVALKHRKKKKQQRDKRKELALSGGGARPVTARR